MDSPSKSNSNPLVALRRAEDTDAQAIMQIHRDAAFALAAGQYDERTLSAWAPVSEERLQAIKQHIGVDEHAGLTLVAECNRQPCGFARVDLLSGEIASLYVAPSAGGIGIGKQLLSALIKAALQAGHKKLWLNAALNAVPFYTSQGFDPGESMNYRLPGGEVMTVIRMHKRIDA